MIVRLKRNEASMKVRANIRKAVDYKYKKSRILDFN